jgi:hypothetical protein
MSGRERQTQHRDKKISPQGGYGGTNRQTTTGRMKNTRTAAIIFSVIAVVVMAVLFQIIFYTEGRFC